MVLWTTTKINKKTRELGKWVKNYSLLYFPISVSSRLQGNVFFNDPIKWKRIVIKDWFMEYENIKWRIVNLLISLEISYVDILRERF